MSKIDIITLFPEMIENAVSYGVLHQAIKSELLSVQAHSPREFSSDKHKSADDRPFGGGDGMIMLAEPLAKSLEKVQQENSKIIYLSPQGKTFTNEKAKELALASHVVLVCGRYGGVDQRILNQFAIEEISIGDYVLSGGELGALVVVDALARFIPGVLGHQNSAEADSFENGLLEQPNFTRPREFQGEVVPEILMGGNHKLISEWKTKVSALVTLVKRPDLFKKYIQQENEKYFAQKKKKTAAPLIELHNFWKSLSVAERKTLGLQILTEEDFK